MKFAQFNAQGNLIARFDSDIHGSNVPADAVEIPEDLFWSTINEIDGVWMRDLASGVIDKHPFPALTLDQAKSEQIARINSKCQELLSSIVLPYPPDETLTWPNQYAEAQAFTASSSAQTPMLSAIATASGQTVAALAQSVLTKSAAYNAAAGTAVGKRQALTAQVMAVKDADMNPVDAVRAIVW